MTDSNLVEVGNRRNIIRIPGYLEPDIYDYSAIYEFYRGDNCFSNECYNVQRHNGTQTEPAVSPANSLFSSKPRTPDEVFTWDETFMLQAASSGLRSKDNHTQVGALIERNNCPVSSGYNGPAHGVDNRKVSWDRQNSKGYRYTKYADVIHAEQNAIYNALSLGLPISGSTIYTSLFPCKECAKAIAQCGIREVVFMQIPHYQKEDESLTDKEGASFISTKIP